MPLEDNVNRYGHLLSDGTDISRMTVEQIAVAQRKLSPKFPSIVEALERRQRLRETVAARSLLAFTVVGLVYGFGWGEGFGFIIAGFSFFGFLTTCFVAGNRLYKRNGESGHGKRPF
jgi:hypothetical protein